jgi:hypothetical protein
VVSCLCGIGRLWRKSECVREFTIAHLETLKMNSPWAIAGVYEPNSDYDRRFLWKELVGLLSRWNLSWCMGGGFNVTRFPSEKSGEARFIVLLCLLSSLLGMD